MNAVANCARNSSCSLTRCSRLNCKIARHHAGDAVVVETDQLAQERDRQQRLSALAAFLLDDDLGQNRMREVVAVLGVVDDEIAVAAHHLGEIFQRHVGAGLGIIEPPVGVLLDDDRFAFRSLRFVDRGWFSIAFAFSLSTAYWQRCCTAAAYHTLGGSPLDVSATLLSRR